jgi:hypothetical protein
MSSFEKSLKPQNDPLKNYISTLRNYYIENYYIENSHQTNSQPNKSKDFKDSAKIFDTFIKKYNYADLNNYKTCKDFNDLYSTVCNFGRNKTCRAFTSAMNATNVVYESAFNLNEYNQYENIHKHLNKIINTPGHCNISMGGKSKKRRNNKKRRNTRRRKV